MNEVKPESKVKPAMRVLPKVTAFAADTALQEVDKLRQVATDHEAMVAAPGFEGVRSASVVAGEGGKAATPLETAKGKLSSVEVVDRVAADDWEKGEDVRVLIAVREDSGATAEVKQLPLGQVRVAAVLKLYLAELAERDREAKKAESAKKELSLDEQQKLLDLKKKRAAAVAAEATAKTALDKATAAGDLEAKVAAKDALAKATRAVQSAELNVKNCESEHKQFLGKA